jgi:sorting and assembly machinery component 37
MFYSLNSNWYGLTLPALANMLYIPQRYYVPARLRESYRPRLEAAELWSLPGLDQENEEKTRFGQKPKEEGESRRKEKFKGVFQREKAS